MYSVRAQADGFTYEREAITQWLAWHRLALLYPPIHIPIPYPKPKPNANPNPNPNP